MIIANLLQNTGTARRIVADVALGLPATRDCSCASALDTAIVTSRALVPAERLRELAPILRHYAETEVAAR